MPTVQQLEESAKRYFIANSAKREFARELERIAAADSGHSTREFEQVRARALFLQELNHRYPQIAARLYELERIMPAQLEAHPYWTSDHVRMDIRDGREPRPLMTDSVIRDWVLDHLDKAGRWPEGDFTQQAVACWVWQFNADVAWIRAAGTRSLFRARLGDDTNPQAIGLGWADQIVTRALNKVYPESKERGDHDYYQWDGEAPHVDWVAVPIYLQHLIVPVHAADGVKGDALLGDYRPRLGDTKAAAKRRIMAELGQRVDELLTRLEELDRSDPDVVKPVGYRHPEHMDWLIRAHFLGQTQTEIADAEGVTQQSVSEAIRRAADVCELPYRANPGGAPKGKGQRRAR